MATKNPRLNVVLEPAIYGLVRRLAKVDGVSLSLKARDLIREALEAYEDSAWAREAKGREKTFDRKNAIDHGTLWK